MSKLNEFTELYNMNLLNEIDSNIKLLRYNYNKNNYKKLREYIDLFVNKKEFITIFDCYTFNPSLVYPYYNIGYTIYNDSYKLPEMTKNPNIKKFRQQMINNCNQLTKEFIKINKLNNWGFNVVNNCNKSLNSYFKLK